MKEYKELVYLLWENQNLLDHSFLKNAKRDFSKKHNLSTLVPNTKLLRVYHKMCKNWEISYNKNIETVLRKRAIRSQSGIVPVQVLTKPFRCPGKCIFCPNDPTMPKSYIKTEPGAMRALLNQFDPYKQVYNRLLSLTLTWHPTDKIEMIVLWWTWDVYPQDYKENFVKGLYDACNTFPQFFENVEMNDSKIETDTSNKFSFTVNNLDSIQYPQTIEESLNINEKSKNRIIGLTIETRPEFVNDENCKFWRKLWVTRLEIWVQSMFDSVLAKNKRWHSVEDIRKALHKLRQYGFKFSIHIMPWLYGSSISKDLRTLKKIYSDPFIKPDELKFYPTSVIQNTELYDLYKSWKYKPIQTNEIQKLVKKFWLEIIPPYSRIKRLIRDIPSTEIEAWSNITNLSQIAFQSLIKHLKTKPRKSKKLYSRLYPKYKIFADIKEFLSYESTNKRKIRCNFCSYIIWKKPDLLSFRNFVSLDTRSRELRNNPQKESHLNLIIRKYKSSVGIEYFISFEDLKWYLYGFVRLLLPNVGNFIDRDWLWDNTAIIRELHIYWNLASIEKDIENNQVQHTGLGKQLMDLAEKITYSHNYKKLSVISGIWVREYYKKLWYNLDWTYMVKDFE